MGRKYFKQCGAYNYLGVPADTQAVGLFAAIRHAGVNCIIDYLFLVYLQNNVSYIYPAKKL
jgi:hypothetical protein